MKSILEKSRYLAIIGVVSLLIAAVTAFAWGLIKTINTIALVVTSAGGDAAIIIEFIKIVDGFLVATAILIFAVSLCKRTPRLKAEALSLNPKVRDHWQVYNCPVNPKADTICTRSISTRLDAEDFMQRTIILCNHIFSIGKVLQAVSPQKWSALPILYHFESGIKVNIETNPKEGGGISSPCLNAGVSMPRI